MKKAAYAFLLSVLMLNACSKPIQEEQNTIRLPAESADMEEDESYVYLEKTELRNEDIISRPYFFRECSVDGNNAKYSNYGITACLSLEKAENSTPSSLLKESKAEALKTVKLWEYTVSETVTGEDYCMTEISYTKEVTKKKKNKVVTYQYPCKYIIKVDTLVDGNYLLITLDVDNENADEMTEALLEEFLDACGITVT